MCKRSYLNHKKAVHPSGHGTTDRYATIKIQQGSQLTFKLFNKLHQPLFVPKNSISSKPFKLISLIHTLISLFSFMLKMHISWI